jgi:hypothetical protein
VPPEDVVLVAAGAVPASHAAENQHAHARRNQQREDNFVDRKPMDQVHADQPYPQETQEICGKVNASVDDLTIQLDDFSPLQA